MGTGMDKIAPLHLRPRKNDENALMFIFFKPHSFSSLSSRSLSSSSSFLLLQRNSKAEIGTKDSTKLFDAEFSDGNEDVELVSDLLIIGSVSETEETDTEKNAGGEVKRELERILFVTENLFLNGACNGGANSVSDL